MLIISTIKNLPKAQTAASKIVIWKMDILAVDKEYSV